MDFLIGKLYYSAIGRGSGFLMKKDWFFFPLGCLLRAMGGISVDRSRRGDTVGRLVRDILECEEVHIAITPEGTRSYKAEWHTGFYRIALEAGIPIELAVIDYRQRAVGIFDIFYPTGDMERDIAEIQQRYHSSQAKYPEKYHDHHVS